ncbi:MAG: restriction endonuclease subunit S [Treponema sp.]|uniref:restriction endonuclease subunit S n=1 Tax=Treponema sp. TaxID=166 RepID=UPI002A9183FA|nr:restriction endonuclease subunit S [Treponema sp.]MDY6398436.1 restriction endonuclease subunit S [Treponema sp.]
MKQTEVGLIPDDWEVKRFDELFSISTETVPLADINQRCYVGTENMLQDKKGVAENTIELKYQNVREYRKDDILISNIRPYLKKIWFADKDGGCSTDVLVFRKIRNTDNANFLFKIVSDDRFFNIVNDNAVGTKMPRGDKNIIKQVLFAIPTDKEEQQRIAKALSDADALISTTEKLLQKKKNIKQGAMQELLTGKKRLPGFAKSTRAKMTELGEIPEDWEVKTLSEIFEFKQNNTFTRDCLNDSKGEYQNVHYGDVLIKYPSILDCSKETIPFINEGINVKFSKYGIVEGDIIIADTAEDETVGKAVEIYNLGNRKIVSGLHTFLCRKMTDDFAPKWLGYFMNQAIFHNQLLPFITGTKVSAISRTAIQNVKVLIPSKEEQTAIANVLSSMDKEIETLNTKLEKYRNLKTAMMQQLLTGKIRLIK